MSISLTAQSSTKFPKKLIEKFVASVIIVKNFKEVFVMKWVCNVCGYEYDEEEGDADNGIEPGTPMDENFVCPLCGVGKEDFSPAE